MARTSLNGTSNQPRDRGSPIEMISVPGISMPNEAATRCVKHPNHAEILGGDSTVLWVHYWTGSSYVLLIATYHCRPLRCTSAFPWIHTKWLRIRLAPNLTGCLCFQTSKRIQMPISIFRKKNIYIYIYMSLLEKSVNSVPSTTFFIVYPLYIEWPFFKGNQNFHGPYQQPRAFSCLSRSSASSLVGWKTPRSPRGKS